MKKPYYLLLAVLMLAPLSFFARGSGPDNPLNENVYEFKGRGFATIMGAGVNATVPQTASITLPAVLATSTVERAYLYANLLYSGDSGDPLATATATLAHPPNPPNNLGTVAPYSSDFVNFQFGDFWNIYKWNVTDIVGATGGGGTYVVTVDSSETSAIVNNVLLVVIYSDTNANYEHIILNDGIEALGYIQTGVNQTTTFNNVGPSFSGGSLSLAVSHGQTISGNESYEVEIPSIPWIFGISDNIWNSTDGPSLDIKLHHFSFSLPTMPVTDNIKVTLGTGLDDIGWEVALLEAYLRDVSADSQTHPNAQVVSGDTETVTVVVSNNGDPMWGIIETFDVTLYGILGATTTAIDTQTVTNLAPASSTTLTFNWDTTGWAPGTYTIQAHADSANAITEFDEANNYCDDPATLRIMAPPVAVIGGPYEGDEGSPILFDGGASYDPDGTIVSWEWDLDNDGLYDDDSGQQASYIWGHAGSYAIGLRVTDNDGLTDTDSTTVIVNNVTPEVSAGPDQESLPGHQYTEFCFTGKFKDPSWLDTHTAMWDFGDGSPTEAGVITYEPTSPPNPAAGIVDESPRCHLYWVPYQDNYTVTLTVTDDSGDAGTDTITVTILRVVGGEEVPLNAGSVLASVLCSYWWVPTLMAIVLTAVLIKKRHR